MSIWKTHVACDHRQGGQQAALQGSVPTVVKRYVEDGVYNGGYPKLGTIKLQHICKVPEHARSFVRGHAL